MIRSLLFLAFFAPPDAAPAPSPAPQPEATAAASPVPGETPVPAPVAEQAADAIDAYSAPVDVLTERMIGVASRAVRFDWRRKWMGFGATGGELLEMNNFRSRRIGVSTRRPFDSVMGDMAISWVQTQGSPSSRKLALTPYRQIGRPSRLELDVNVGYPLAEGVATSRPGFFPATELVFSAQAGLRYLNYPGAIEGADVRDPYAVRDMVGSFLRPTLTKGENRYLEKHRLGGMEVDRARYNLLTGLGADVYFHSGGYVSPRAMVALPVTGTGLGFWWELSLDAGWMF